MEHDKAVGTCWTFMAVWPDPPEWYRLEGGGCRRVINHQTGRDTIEIPHNGAPCDKWAGTRSLILLLGALSPRTTNKYTSLCAEKTRKLVTSPAFFLFSFSLLLLLCKKIFGFRWWNKMTHEPSFTTSLCFLSRISCRLWFQSALFFTFPLLLT